MLFPITFVINEVASEIKDISITCKDSKPFSQVFCFFNFHINIMPDSSKIN